MWKCDFFFSYTSIILFVFKNSKDSQSLSLKKLFFFQFWTRKINTLQLVRYTDIVHFCMILCIICRMKHVDNNTLLESSSPEHPHLNNMGWMMRAQTHNCILTQQQAEGVQEELLCAAVSSSLLCRFFALISFMASSMERVSRLLATGTEDRGLPMKRLNPGALLSPFRASTHHSRKTCWPPACALRL